MVHRPQVSVVLTSYNHAQYLREAIDSVLNQTFRDFELIIWDDASTDSSWKLICSYSDKRMRAFRNEANRGFSVCINAAISEAPAAKYIAVHHSDDVWEPDKLEKQVAFLESHPGIGAVFTNATIIGEQGELFDDRTHFYHQVFDQPNRTRHEWLNYFFYHGNALCHPSVLMHRACHDECGLYKVGLDQLTDLDMWVRLCRKYEIHVLPEKMVRFRVRAGEANLSGNRPETRIRWQFESYEILQHYRGIPSFEELVKVFPGAEAYKRQQGCDLGFALGMIAIQSKTSRFMELFGLDLLLESLNGPERVKKIRELYGFGEPEFAALTARHDVFATELTELFRGGEPLLVLLGKLRLWLVPRNSSRARVLRRLLRWK